MSHSVLIVDDSVLMRAALKRTIGMIDVGLDELHEAENGQEALDFLSSNTVDLILTDLNMPVMGGIELVHRLKESKDLSSIPVIVITTESSTVRIEDLQEEGIDDYLHKPFTPEEFRTVITRNLGVCNESN
jgi:two-component system chemotaxis response regulator CheY